MPILEGAQGKRKSTFISILALNYAGNISEDVGDTARMIESMMGKWIVELPELSVMRRSDINHLKDFVTRTSDRARLAYDRRAGEYPRRSVFMGSTNDDKYLKDLTGGRRWWPIKVMVDMIDTDRLEREVPQVLAEARAMYLDMRRLQPRGNLPLFLTRGAETEAVVLQESRRIETAEEVLGGRIEAWLDTPIGAEFSDLADAPPSYRNETCVAEVWADCLGNRGTPDQMNSMKIGTALNVIGWARSEGPVRTGPLPVRFGKSVRVYRRPPASP